MCTDSELLQPMSVLKRGMAVSMQASGFAAHVSKLIQDIGYSLGLKVGHLYAKLLRSTFRIIGSFSLPADSCFRFQMLVMFVAVRFVH